jgi:two-component system chemotaxis response regulator CheB
MIVDDSAVVRQVLGSLLAQDADISVVTASDALIALDKLRQVRPDVIVLDLELPHMDGLTFLRKLMDEDPLPVVVCSTLLGRGPEVAVRALALGAVDVVAKPQLAVRAFFEEAAERLRACVRAAAQARVRRRPLSTFESAALAPAPAPAPAPPKTAHNWLGSAAARAAARVEVVAIGASTGGPEALRVLLDALPADLPPLVVVQHMPERFTQSFAAHLDRECPQHVAEAGHGQVLEPGDVWIAPGNRHLSLERHTDGRLYTRLSDGPLVQRHRPSVDVLLRSVAEVARSAAIGIVLTGMGSDGAQGLLEMRRAGATTWAQDEASSVVYGMPKEALAAGASMRVLALHDIAPVLLAQLGRHPRD